METSVGTRQVVTEPVHQGLQSYAHRRTHLRLSYSIHQTCVKVYRVLGVEDIGFCL